MQACGCRMGSTMASAYRAMGGMLALLLGPLAKPSHGAVITLDSMTTVPSGAAVTSDWVQLLAGAGFGAEGTLCAGTDPVVFYKGNSCQQETCGSTSLTSNCTPINLVTLDCFEDNAARSLLILPGTEFPCGSRIAVSSEPEIGLNDDLADVTLKQALAPNQAYCVDSFETSYEDKWVQVVFYHGGGVLDGSASQLYACGGESNGALVC